HIRAVHPDVAAAEHPGKDDAEYRRHGDRIKQRPANAQQGAPVAGAQIHLHEGQPKVAALPDGAKICRHAVASFQRLNPPRPRNRGEGCTRCRSVAGRMPASRDKVKLNRCADCRLSLRERTSFRGAKGDNPANWDTTRCAGSVHHFARNGREAIIRARKRRAALTGGTHGDRMENLSRPMIPESGAQVCALAAFPFEGRAWTVYTGSAGVESREVMRG